MVVILLLVCNLSDEILIKHENPISVLIQNTLRKIIAETLKDDHELSDFNCESEDLNNFLKDDALTQQKSKLNLTKVVMCDDTVVGYVFLLTDTIPLKDIS